MAISLKVAMGVPVAGMTGEVVLGIVERDEVGVIVHDDGAVGYFVIVFVSVLVIVPQ